MKIVEKDKREKGSLDKMERVTTKEAAKKLNMDVVTLQYLMRQERLPIGYAVKKEGKKRYHYIIYRTMLDSFIQRE